MPKPVVFEVRSLRCGFLPRDSITSMSCTCGTCSRRVAFFFFHRGLPVRHREGCKGERWSFFPRGVWTLGTIFVFCFPFNLGKRWPFFPGGLLDVRKHLFPT